MDKAQAIHKLWSSFGLDAYDQSTVPEGAQMPYITYNVTTGALDNVLNISGSLWYNSYSWEEISKKADEIAQKIGAHGYYLDKVDGGYLMVVQGRPFAQRMQDENDAVRRIYINLNAEFLTAY